MRKILVTIFLVWAAWPAVAQSMLRGDVPGWVMPADLPVMAPDLYRRVQNGENFLMVDQQFRWIGSTRETYVRLVSEVVSRPGLEGVASVARSFDPNIETLTLVRLDVVRDGVRRALRDTVPVELMRRETQLDRGIIDGTLTAHMTVPGVQVGDRVDVAFVWRTKEYFAGYNFAGRYQMNYSVPVGLSRVVVNWPKDRAINLAPVPDWVTAQVRQTADATQYQWTASNTAPRARAPDAPPEYDPWGAVEFSGFQTWADVAASLAGYYTRPRAVPQAWQARIQAIAQRYDNAEDRAFAALRLVQDEIRYVGLEVGAGGYYARSPRTVVQNAYGDCKDKALLLRTVLDALGIRSTVALASLQTGYGNIDRLPSAQPFDHMIVGAQLRGQTVWMDPTASNEGGDFDSAVQPDLGYVLPLRPVGATLEKITPLQPVRFQRDMTETFLFTTQGTILQVQTRFTGEGANLQRSFWAQTPADRIAAEFLGYYARSYPGIRATDPPVMTDQRDANVISVLESYLIPRAGVGDAMLYRDFPFLSGISLVDFPDFVVGERRDPLAIQGSVRLSHKVQVRNAPVEFNAPEDAVLGGNLFRSTLAGKAWQGGNMDLTWTYQSQRRSVPAAKVARAVRDARQMRANSAFFWDLTPVSY
jgi:transglutaminase-like putative cysteine protease